MEKPRPASTGQSAIDERGEPEVKNIAALFVTRDSLYKDMPGVDCYDIDRDAMTWPEGCPAVCHPPCRSWGRLKAFAKPRPDEQAQALLCVEALRRNGGILEHPQGSSLWDAAGMPKPWKGRDQWGGFSVEVDQLWWGHKARKRTWFYIVGLKGKMPPFPTGPHGQPEYVMGGGSKGIRSGDPMYITDLPKSLREKTPPALMEWLVAVARECGPPEVTQP